MTDVGRRVVLDAGSIDLRRQLGATAWVVFEELLLVSSGPVEACHASVSVRSLAARLGLAVDDRVIPQGCDQVILQSVR